MSDPSSIILSESADSSLCAFGIFRDCQSIGCEHARIRICGYNYMHPRVFGAREGFMKTIRIFAVIALFLLVASFSISAADEPLAFLIGYKGSVKVAGESPKLGMAIFADEAVTAGKNSNASILLIDDNLYKIGASSSINVEVDLVEGDMKKLPRKDGTWVILYKKFQDRVKAQKDISQYGAVRTASLSPDMKLLSKREAEKLVDKTRKELELEKGSVEFFLVGGSVWEYHSFYAEALATYNEGLTRFPTSSELIFARAVVSAKIKG